MTKRENLIQVILELRQELINKGSSVTQGDVIALLAAYDALLNELTDTTEKVA